MNKKNHYRPSDDTYLLADCAKNYRGDKALEIAGGTGYISKVLRENFRDVVATDIDFNSIRMVPSSVLVVCCDGASAITNILFDLIVINPPYLPSTGIHDIAVDGGEDGIEVTIKMVDDAMRLLDRDGTILIVTSSLANHDKVLEYLRNSKCTVDIVANNKLDFEELLVIRARCNSSLQSVRPMDKQFLRQTSHDGRANT